MSLDTLIDTEITKFIETRSIKYLMNVEKYVQVLKENIITERFLRKLGFSSNDIEFFVFQLKFNNNIIEKIQLTCCEYQDTYEISINDLVCPICKNNINQYDHELEPLYQNTITSIEYNTLKRTVSNKLAKVFLRADYQENYNSLMSKIKSTVPLIGAGFSLPLGAPSWKDLFLEFSILIPDICKDEYIAVINEGEYFKGISMIKSESKSIRNDEQLKKKVVDILKNKLNYDISKEKHNYVDLFNLQFPFYLTTNYDNALHNFFPDLTIPIQVEDLEDMQDQILDNKFNIIHIHGILHKPKSLVLTKDDYFNKYQDKVFKDKILALLACKTLLFLGHSFSDDYFTKLYENIQHSIGGVHFIITTDESRIDDLISHNILPIIFRVNDKVEYIWALKQELFVPSQKII